MKIIKPLEKIIKKDEENGWFFWDETFSEKIGYYKTEKEAVIALRKYIEELEKYYKNEN